MKKIHKLMIGMSIYLLPLLLLAADDGLDEGIGMVAKIGTLFGVLIVVVAVSLWMLPIAFATLVYTGQKKKAEQMHEEVGLKAAVLALLAGILGAMMAYYVVGTIGKFAGKEATLAKGNEYIVSRVVGTGAKQIKKQGDTL